MVDWWTVGPRVVLVVVLLVTNVAIVGALSSSATPYGPYNSEWDGTSEFRTSLDNATLMLDTTRYGAVNATDSTAFVVAPQETYDAASTARIRQYVRRGGTLVVMAESNRTNRLLAGVGADARIGDDPLRDPQSNFRDPALPVANNVSDHPLVEDVESITLNHARAVEANDATVLARTAPTTYVDRNRNETFDDADPVGTVPVATVEPVGEGRVVVVSDASVATNALWRQTDNRAFVRGLSTSNATLLDQSHAGPLPPVPYAATVLRTTPLAQFVLGIGAFGLLAVAAVGAPSRLWRRFSDGDDPVDVALSEDDIARYLADAHPDWDDERIERVTKAINRTREDNGDNG